MGIGGEHTATSLAAADRGVRPQPMAFAVWGLVRLPLLVGLLILFREPVSAFLTNLNVLIDPARFTHRAIDLMGTPIARLLLFAAFAVAVAAICLVARKLSPLAGFLLSLGGVLVVGAATLVWGGTSLKFLAPIALLAATNLLPDRLFERLTATPARGQRFMTYAVGIAEVLMLRRYLEWIAGIAARRPVSLGNGLLGTLPTALLLGLAMALLLKAGSLVPIEQALRMSSDARIISQGNYNWIEMDAEGRHLMVSGHGAPHLLRYDLADLTAAPLKSPVDNQGAQGFAYDPAAREVYILNTKSRELLFLDASTLQQKRSIPVPNLSDGDSWIAVDGPTDTLTLASEADTETGVPFLVIDRRSGAVKDKRDLDPGNLLARPDSSFLYLSFFRRRNSIMIYDLATQTIKAEAAAPSQVDRMLYDRSSNEVLLAVPLESRIARFQADTLQPAGDIKTLFGVRVMALDQKQQVLLVGSLVTGEIAIIDFRNGDELARHYLGPWLRTIQADPARSRAYVSSNGALYELNYGNLR